jgi:hypothetical protein
MRSPLLAFVLWSATAFAGPDSRPPAASAPAPAPSPAPTAQAPAPPGQVPAPTAPTPRAVAPTLTKLNPDELPEPCRDLAKLGDSASKAQAFSARISLASCLVDQAAKPLVLCDCEQSIIDINAAIDPSMALLDEVVLLGDPVTKILARHTQGELLTSFAQRVLATIPPAIDSTDVGLRETRLAMVQPLIQPWLARAQAAFTELDKIARTNPQLAKNPAVLAAVRSSRAKLAQSASATAKR